MTRQIRRKVRAVQWRLVWIALCRRALGALAAASAGLAVYVLAGRLVPLAVAPLQVLPWVAGAAAVWVVAWTLLRRVRLLEAAVRADEALGLKERLSTALALGAPKTQAEEAVLEDAAAHARGVRAGRAFPMRLGRPLRRAALSVGMLVLLWLYMPQFNLLAKASSKQNGPAAVTIEARQEVAKQLEDLAKELAQADESAQPQVAQKLDKDLEALARQIKEKQLTGEQASAKIEKMGEKIAQRREEIEKKLEQTSTMKARGEGRNTSEIAKALQKGEFAKAAKALEELKKQIQSGQMSPEQKQELAKEMAQLAAQLGKESPLAEALAKAADKMKQGEMNGALGEMEAAAAQMKDLEGLLKEMKALEGLEQDMEGRKRALNGQPVPCDVCGEMCIGGMCEGCAKAGRGKWKPGDSRERGAGMGGPGIGEGSVAEAKEGQIGFEKKRLKGDITPGQIIARMKVPGQQPPGEIKTQFEELRVESEQAAEDTIRNEQLPLEHKALVRRYFDAIKEEKPATPAPAATPSPAGGQGAPPPKP